MKRKRITAAALAAIMMTVTAGSVSAVDMDIVYEAGGYSNKEIKLMNKINTMLANHDQSTLDISSYDLSFDEFEDLYGTVVFNHPEYYYVSMVSAKLEYKTKKHVLKFTPIYTRSSAYAKKMSKEIKAEADRIIAGIDSRMTDPEKVLYIHDAIVGLCDYYEGSTGNIGRSIHSTLVGKSSVCVGYALTFQYFMDRLDIPCICITNEDHIWNMVQIDGNWYHVDTTWDDMNSESPNFVMHDMVLLSEYALDTSAVQHSKWRYGMVADSPKFDDMFWNESTSKINYLNGYWYYNTFSGFYRYSFKTKKAERIFTKSSVWHPGGKALYVSFGKNIIVGDTIWFSTDKDVYRYDPASGQTKLMCSLQLTGNDQIYELDVKGSDLLVYYSDDFEKAKKHVKKFPLKVSSAESSGKMAIEVESDSTTFTLSWNDSIVAEKYYIYRYDKKAKKAALIYKTIDSSVTFRKNADQDNYMYAVKVLTAEGLSDYSEWKTV